MKSFNADILLLIAAIAWGSGFVVMDFALKMNIPVYTLLFLRFFIAGIVLSPMVCVRRKCLSWSLVRVAFLCGIFLFVAYVFQTYALLYTTPSKNAFYTVLYVFFVPVLYWIVLRKIPNIFVFIALIPLGMGVAVLSLDSFSELANYNFGDFLTMVCSVVFAIQILFLGIFNRTYDPVLMTFFQVMITVVGSAVFMFMYEVDALFQLTSQSIGVILYLAFFCTLLAFTLQNIAQKYTTQSRTAILMSSESLFGTMFSVLFGIELFSFSLLIGGFLIFLGIVIVETRLNFIRSLFKVKSK